MFKNNHGKYRIGTKYSKVYNRQLNNIILVLLILLIILIIKLFNNSTSNNIIDIIEKNIFYEFSWKSDGKRIIEHMTKVMGNTKKTVETINIRIWE